MLSRRAAVVFAFVDLLTGAFLAAAVFLGLPARFALVDAAAAVLVTIQWVAAMALLARASWAIRAASAAAIAWFIVGLMLVTALALTASWLSGVYGSVGRGGGIIFALIALMVVPYLVAIPALQLFWIHSKPKAPQ